GPQPAALRRATHRRHAEASGGRRFQIRPPRPGHRHQPTVPDETHYAHRPRNPMTLTSSPLQRNSRELSRRTFLRATGVVMALPWLESLPVWGAQPVAAAAAPRRLAFLFMGNGVNPTQWWAKGSGAGMALGP